MRTQAVKVHAFHEAAHAVAFLRHGIRFRSIYLCDENGVITLSDGSRKTDANGTVELDDPRWAYEFFFGEKHEREIPILTLLVGIVTTKRLMPHHSYSRIVEGGAGLRDWVDAVRYVTLCNEWHDGRQFSPAVANVHVWLCVRRAREFVKHEWEVISKVGNSLLGSSNRALNFDQVSRIVATE